MIKLSNEIILETNKLNDINHLIQFYTEIKSNKIDSQQHELNIPQEQINSDGNINKEDTEKEEENHNLFFPFFQELNSLYSFDESMKINSDEILEKILRRQLLNQFENVRKDFEELKKLFGNEIKLPEFPLKKHTSKSSSSTNSYEKKKHESDSKDSEQKEIKKHKHKESSDSEKKDKDSKDSDKKEKEKHKDKDSSESDKKEKEKHKESSESEKKEKDSKDSKKKKIKTKKFLTKLKESFPFNIVDVLKEKTNAFKEKTKTFLIIKEMNSKLTSFFENINNIIENIKSLKKFLKDIPKNDELKESKNYDEIVKIIEEYISLEKKINKSLTTIEQIGKELTIIFDYPPQKITFQINDKTEIEFMLHQYYFEENYFLIHELKDFLERFNVGKKVSESQQTKFPKQIYYLMGEILDLKIEKNSIFDFQKYLNQAEAYIIANIKYRIQRAREELPIDEISQLNENSTQKEFEIVYEQITSMMKMKAYEDLKLFSDFNNILNDFELIKNVVTNVNGILQITSPKHIIYCSKKLIDLKTNLLKERSTIGINLSSEKSFEMKLGNDEEKKESQNETTKSKNDQIIDLTMMKQIKDISNFFETMKFDKKLHEVSTFIKQPQITNEMSQLKTKPLIIQQTLSFKTLMEGGKVTIQIESELFEIEISKGMKLTKPIEKEVNEKKYHIYFKLEEDTSKYHFTKNGNNLICELSSQSLLPGYHEIILPTNERVWIHYSSSESIVSIRNKGFPISSSSSQYERGLLIVKII